MGNILDVPDRRALRRSHDTHFHRILRDGLFIFFFEHAHFFELVTQGDELFVEQSRSLKADIPRVQLIASALLIDIDRASADHSVPVLHRELKIPAVSGEHDA